MYQKRDTASGVVAIAYFFTIIVGYVVMGILYKQGMAPYTICQWILFAVPFGICAIKDKNFRALGLTREKIRINLIIFTVIVALSVIYGLVVSTLPVYRVLRGALYYLFYIALVEEVEFRGFLQNYLFGLQLHRAAIYLLGALMFSLMHLPFQMYVNQSVLWSYVVVALPQLIFTFVFHLAMCFVSYKRGDISVPVAWHFALDFLQAV